MSSSFQKKVRNSANKIPGTKVTGHEILTSTGIPSFDSCIGGGLAIGSILLIEEDDQGLHSRLLSKYFIAEGLTFGQKIVICTSDTPAQNLLKDIPTAAKKTNNTTSTTIQVNSNSSSEPLKIAWRYQQLPTAPLSSQPRSFDWSQPIGEEDIKNIAVFEGALTYSGVLRHIVEAVRRQKSAASSTSLLRIVIEGLGSPLWEDEENLTSFVFCLRALVRDSCCVVMLSLPTYWLQQNPGRRKEIRRLADVVINLQIFKKNDKHSHFKDYNGFIHFHRVTRPNTAFHKMVSNRQDMVYFIKRKAFVIEKLHLPPALDQAPSVKVAPRHMCASRPGTSILDF